MKPKNLGRFSREGHNWRILLRPVSLHSNGKGCKWPLGWCWFQLLANCSEFLIWHRVPYRNTSTHSWLDFQGSHVRFQEGSLTHNCLRKVFEFGVNSFSEIGWSQRAGSWNSNSGTHCLQTSIWKSKKRRLISCCFFWSLFWNLRTESVMDSWHEWSDERARNRFWFKHTSAKSQSFIFSWSGRVLFFRNPSI